MSLFTDRLKDRDFPGQIESLRELIANLEEPRREIFVNTDPESYTRLLAVLDRALIAVEGANPLLVSQSQIQTLEDSLNSIRNIINAFSVDGNAAHLVQVFVVQADVLLTVLTSWFKFSEPSAAIAEIVNQTRLQMTAELDRLKGSIASAATDIANIAIEATEVKDSLTQLFAEQRAAVEAEIAQQEARIEDLRNTIDQQRPRIDEVISNFQSQFTQSQQQRQQETTQAKEEIKKEFAELLDLTRSSADGLIGGMKASLVEAQELVGTIGVTGAARGYEKEADSQKNIADNWRYAAAAIGAAAGVVLLLFFHRSLNPAQQIGHILTSAAMLGIAGYAAQQSALHRRREADARKKFLALVAFSPMAEPLDTARKLELREKLIESTLLNVPDGPEGEDSISSSQVSVIKQLFELWRNK